MELFFCIRVVAWVGLDVLVSMVERCGDVAHPARANNDTAITDWRVVVFIVLIADYF